jgi:hypothetical protein
MEAAAAAYYGQTALTSRQNLILGDKSELKKTKGETQIPWEEKKYRTMERDRRIKTQRKNHKTTPKNSTDRKQPETEQKSKQ